AVLEKPSLNTFLLPRHQKDRGRHPQHHRSPLRTGLAPLPPRVLVLGPPRASAVRRSGAASQHRAESMIDVVGKLAALRVKRNQGLPLDLLSEDENMSFTSTKGWPASSFYIEGNRFDLDSVFDRNGYMERLKFDL
ncbi:hypothetical protein PHJA_001754000, partial [Phtheirospermum japonicum]